MLLLAAWLPLCSVPGAYAADGQDTTGVDSGTQTEGRLAKSTRLIKQEFLNIGDNLEGITLYPFMHPKQTLLFLGGVGGLIAVDKPVTRYYQDNVEPAFNGYTMTAPRKIDKLGIHGTDFYLWSGVGASYALGVAFNDERSQRAALLAAKAGAYSVLFSHLILKSIIGRKRPVPNLSTATGDSGSFTTNPYAFGHWQRPRLGSYASGTSMPSFHFTEYFAIARVYSKVYDNYLVPYGVAAALLTANIRGHHHWVSDMVAGALIGTAIGNVVADDSDASEKAATTTSMIIPSYTGNEVSLNYFRQF